MASTITNQTEKESFNKPLLRKKQILSHYSESAWLLSILGKFHHISPTLNTIVLSQTVPYEKTPQIEYM